MASPAPASAETPDTESTLLQLLGPDPRNAIESLIRVLKPEDRAGLDLVASLIVRTRDEALQEALLLFLDDVIASGVLQNAVSVSLQYQQIGNKLLQKTADVINAQARSAERNHGSFRAYLSFANSTAYHLSVGEAQAKLLLDCLELLSDADDRVCMSAKEYIFATLSASSQKTVKDFILCSRDRIWETVQRLASSSSNKVHIMLGYSLWLRWLVSVEEEALGGLMADNYWRLVLSGLRYGDSERRKLSLNILKLSMAADSALVSKNEREQYIRYCTVFETIVLSRYINQVEECEKDLYYLATESCVTLNWLYCLLASGLDKRMQESNRKFIGNWVTRSSLQPNDDFLAFFEDVFLPWAIQGQLFVSTLRRRDGVLRCHHGDRLCTFIKRLLQDSTDTAQLVDMIMKAILRNKNSMFAYATVYLLKTVDGFLQPEQQETIAGITNLPEVARDYVQLVSSRAITAPQNKSGRSRREMLEQDSIKKCEDFTGEHGVFQEIWTDLDYLEYPKKLLMVIPRAVMHPKLIQQALENAQLASELAEKLQSLQRISETKTFLFTALVCAMRCSVLKDPNALQIFDIADFIVRAASYPPEPTIDLMLEEAIVPLTPYSYKHYFGDHISYGIAALLDLVGRLHEHQDVLRNIFHYLIQPWKDQKLPPPTVSPWKTTLQLQVLLLCFEQYSLSEGDVHALLEDLFHILAIEPLPRYRYLLEWMIVRLFKQHDLKDDLLSRLATKDHHSNPKHLASLMKIGVVLARTQDAGEAFASRLAIAFVPLASSSKVVIRHEAQWQLPILMDRARHEGWSRITDNSALVALEDYIKSMERFHEPPLEREVGQFDPAADHTLTNLVEGRWFGLDSIESPLTSHDEFIKLHASDSEDGIPQSCMVLGTWLSSPPTKQIEVVQPANEKPSVGPRTADDVLALQTKGTAYLARALSDPHTHDQRSGDLIVVGSLVDNPYNLGGLSRVSEIFGASSLCLQNQNVLSNKDFTSVSVSSHLHFPIVQLSATGVPQFLAQRKAEGFTVVGIEQTDRSVILGSESVILPRKVVLVVGSEKEGIPAVVLTECDLLVEIQQQGVTRSLNVQTAVSIVLYEHARQHRRPT